MEMTDFFRARIDAMINLPHPLAVLATRMAWTAIEAALAPKFERKDRTGWLTDTTPRSIATGWVSADEVGLGASEFGATTPNQQPVASPDPTLC